MADAEAAAADARRLRLLPHPDGIASRPRLPLTPSHPKETTMIEIEFETPTPRPPSKRKRKPRSPYVNPANYVELLARIPTAAERIHAAWEAGIVPDFVGRRGRENVLGHGETLARGIMKRDEVLRLAQWVEAIDNAYNLIPRHPPSP